MKKIIYLDNAATTKTSPEVVEAMLPYFTEQYGNASAIYSIGSSNKEVISRARKDIADVLGAKENEIYFTAGGSESDNWALKATCEAYGAKGKHIIKLCDGTACHIRGSMTLVEGITRALGIRDGETTEDGLFTLDALRCIGACGIAPAVSINGKVYPKVAVGQVEGIIDSYRQEAKA